MSPSEADDLLPISALQHLVYCVRRVALVHVLGRWQENVHTAIGREVHSRVDGGEIERRPGVTVLRSVAVRSEQLRLRGIVDLVEVHETGAVVPVEYKKGGRKRAPEADVQLAAQAMALEEMIGRPVPAGAVYLAKLRRRRAVGIDASLRAKVVAAATQLHILVRDRHVPPARFDARCPDCSMISECDPQLDVPVGSLTRRLLEALE